MSPSLALGRSGYCVFAGCSVGIGVTEYLTQREPRKSRYLRSGVSGQLGLSGKLLGVSDVPSSGRAALPPAYDTVIECPTMALKFLRM